MTKAIKDLVIEISNPCIEALEEGTAPWMKSFKSRPVTCLPTNAKTGRRYQGSNFLFLMMAKQTWIQMMVAG